MIVTTDKKIAYKEGFAAGLPIVIGYLPIAAAFGILSKTIGISILDCFLFSAVVFAGSSQFMAINLLSVGTGFGEIILTTLLVNFRHFLMSASLAARLTHDLKKYIPFIAFSLTDETFSVASFRQGPITKEFLLPLQAVSYVAWVVGSVAGYWLGSFLPNIMQDSMAGAIYAMFAALLIPMAKKSYKVLVLALSSGLINTLLNYLHILPKGWSMIFAIVLASGIGTYLYREEEVNEYE